MKSEAGIAFNELLGVLKQETLNDEVDESLLRQQ